MGLFASLFRRKEDTESILESLSAQISTLQETRSRTSDLERRLASRLVFYSSVIYVFAAVGWYYWGAAISGHAWYSRFLYTMPFILSPLLLVLLRRFLRWFFVRRITKAESDLKRLEDEREEIFKQLMEKETYKRVVELMKKYFPEKLKDAADGTERPLGNEGADPGNATQPNLANGGRSRAEAVKRDASPSQGNLRNRRTPALGGQQVTKKPTSSENPSSFTDTLVQHENRMHVQPSNSAMSPQRHPQQHPPPYQPIAPLPRPILPQNRSTFERLIDWALGDGIENRYALICGNCHSHNGMALHEEYEYMSYRCAYCGFFNAAKKTRPGAPLVTQNLLQNQNGGAHLTETTNSSRAASTSRHGSQTNLASTDSGSIGNLVNDNHEAELSSASRE